MDDYISRKVAIQASELVIDRDTSGENAVVNAMTAWKEYIKGLPSEDVQPVRHGRWEIYQLAELGRAWTVQCSVCHAIGFHGKTPYCCECGARMDGEKE